MLLQSNTPNKTFIDLDSLKDNYYLYIIDLNIIFFTNM